MESFGYDPLNRLSTSQVAGQSAKSFSYDAIGNLLSKSNVGSYSYPASGSTSVRPHAVSAITGSVLGVINPSFSYDGNGNFSAGGGRSVSWKSFNAPYVISQGAASTTFAYGPEQQRAKQTLSSGTVITYGGAIEQEQGGSSTKIKTYLPRGLGFIEESGSSALARYFHRDHLGSVIAVSDETGTVLERLSYDAWGKRRYLNGADAPDTLSGAIDRTGYSGAEALDPVTLVHLNGRVYDPLVGHLISADPTVSDASDGQALNRYAYGLNNPLAYTDPSGYTAIQRNDSPPPRNPWEEGVGGSLPGMPCTRTASGMNSCANFNADRPEGAGKDDGGDGWFRESDEVWRREGGVIKEGVLDRVEITGQRSLIARIWEGVSAARELKGRFDDAVWDTLNRAPPVAAVGAIRFARLGNAARAAAAAKGVANFPFRSGEVILREFKTSKGLLDIAAEAEISGRTLHLKDIAIFPRGTDALDLGAREVAALRNQLAQEARALGFDELRITGTRVSGANPGKAVDVLIDLTRLGP